MAEITLPNVRKGGDITFRVGLTDNGVSVDWSGLEEKRAFLMADQQKQISGEMSVAVDAEDPTVLVCTYSGDDRMYLGVNSVVIRAKYMGRLKVYDKKAVNIVGRTSAASGVVVLVDPVVPVQLAVEEVDTTILNNAIDAAIAAAERAEDAAEAAEHMVDIHRGPQGYSAYEIAVQEGYEGTVTDWLASLVGPQGKSAYEVAVDGGFVGTEEEWLLSLVGPQGLSAYQVAVAEGFEGTVTEWLDSLVGPTGATPNLTIGTVETGAAGSTAEAAITGTPENPVLNLKIPQGDPGVAAVKYLKVAELPLASSHTMDALYLVPTQTADVFEVYYTSRDGQSTYSWVLLCTTSVQLSDYATKAEVDQLDLIVSNLSGRFYGVFDDESELPEGTIVGYAFVGTDEPLALFTFDGEDWTDTEVAISGIVGPPGEPGIQGIPGPPGVTSVVASADANVGVPSVDVSLNDGVLTLTFHNIKGAQGNTGSSVDYPFTLVNNVVTDDALQALTASMGKYLNDRINSVIGSSGGTETVDMSSLSRAGYVIASNGTWTQANGTTNKSKSVAIDLTDVIDVKITLSGGNGVIAFLKSLNYSSGGAVDFATGHSSRITISDGNTGEYATIPADAHYLYCSVANTDGVDYSSRYTIVLTKIINSLVRVSDIVDNLNTDDAGAPLSAKQGKTLNDRVVSLEKHLFDIPYTTGNIYIEYDTGNVASTGTTTQHTDYIDVSKYTAVFYSRGKATSTTTKAGMAFYDENKTYISGERFLLGQDSTGYVDSEIAVPATAKYARFSIWNAYEDSFFVSGFGDDESIPDKFSALTKRVGGSLAGKKVSIIGDSISCFGTEAQVRAGQYTTPYFKVLAGDVGNSIQSYVTWLDVYTSVDGTTPTNKTIGGVTLTAAMIGTLQTFTPVADDVGKCIGVPRWASAYTNKPWWQILIEETGMVFCANASWSGGRVVPIPEGESRHDAFVLSEMTSDYTLGRVKGRADDGTDIIPDIIILYRGTNDFSAQDALGAEGLETPDMKTFTGITDAHNFTQGYIWSILRLRTLYPQAVIMLCTLNVFKRVNYSHFPSNNGTYTLPDYNNKIREIANLMGCGVIEFDKDGITFENCYPTYISDSATQPLHPNTTGHKVMGAKAVDDVKYYLP